MDLINLPMVILLVKNLFLQTVISGDTSKLPGYIMFEIAKPAGRFDCLETNGRPGERVDRTGPPPSSGY